MNRQKLKTKLHPKGSNSNNSNKPQTSQLINQYEKSLLCEVGLRMDLRPSRVHGKNSMDSTMCPLEHFVENFSYFTSKYSQVTILYFEQTRA